MKIVSILSIITLSLFSLPLSSQHSIDLSQYAPPTERLSYPDPINFNGNEYFLALSKQNSPTWVQQQYVMRDDDVNDYKELINISYFDKEIFLEDAVNQKINFVENRKEKLQDKYSFVEVTESPDGLEIVVDYITTTDLGEDEEPYAEYNIDRFKSFDNNGKKSFLIYTYSKRLYGDLKYSTRSLSKERGKLLEAIIKTQIPTVTYKPTAVDKKK